MVWGGKGRWVGVGGVGVGLGGVGGPLDLLIHNVQSADAERLGLLQ